MTTLLIPYYVLDAAEHYTSTPQQMTFWEGFIITKMDAFSAYDQKRPAGHPYPFDSHSQRVALLMIGLAKAVGIEQDTAELIGLATLPHDIGKMALPVSIWDSEDKPNGEQKALRRTHVAEGLRILRNELDEEILQSPFGTLVNAIMENHHEALDGSGLFGKTDRDLDLIARMACICDAFDGYSVERPHFGDRDISIKAVITRMRDEKRGQFDNDLLSLFAEMLDQHYDSHQNFVDQCEAE